MLIVIHHLHQHLLLVLKIFSSSPLPQFDQIQYMRKIIQWWLVLETASWIFLGAAQCNNWNGKGWWNFPVFGVNMRFNIMCSRLIIEIIRRLVHWCILCCCHINKIISLYSGSNQKLLCIFSAIFIAYCSLKQFYDQSHEHCNKKIHELLACVCLSLLKNFIANTLYTIHTFSDHCGSPVWAHFWYRVQYWWWRESSFLYLTQLFENLMCCVAWQHWYIPHWWCAVFLPWFVENSNPLPFDNYCLTAPF